MKPIQLKVLTQKDWGIYKELRLLALNDSPNSFGSTFERECGYTDQEWMSRLDLTRTKLALPLIAEMNSMAVGLAWGVVHNPNHEVAHLYQMWVSPKVRGLGVGRLLLSQIIDWAKQLHLKAILLSVTTTNVAAIKLYQSVGFQNDGKLELLREAESLMSQPMKLLLNTN